jgi:hypothetical protein
MSEDSADDHRPSSVQQFLNSCSKVRTPPLLFLNFQTPVMFGSRENHKDFKKKKKTKKLFNLVMFCDSKSKKTKPDSFIMLGLVD